jgi:hypothetical protein
MKHSRWRILLGSFLIALSALLYLIHYEIFRDAHHIFIYMIGDIAFLPIEVLLVTLIIHQLLSEREKRIRLEKLNMVIGAFFSEVGTSLLKYFSLFDPHCNRIRKTLIVGKEWTEKEFLGVSKRLRGYDCEFEIREDNLKDLRSFLVEKMDFLLRLLENPNLLEHESFTNLLQAVFHLAQELFHREDITQLPDTDYEHLVGDIKRVYTSLIHEWLNYMKHLKDNYPYLFSLAMRTNPFDQEASAVVR